MGIGVLSLGQSGRRVKLTTHFHLGLRLRMSGAISPLPLTPSWRGHFTLHTPDSDVPLQDMKTHRDDGGQLTARPLYPGEKEIDVH